MSNKLNAEELAAKRYPNPTAMIPQPDGTFLNINHSATAYAAAIREVAQPIADERDELVTLIRTMNEHEGAEGWSAGMSEVINAILAKYPKP